VTWHEVTLIMWTQQVFRVFLFVFCIVTAGINLSLQQLLFQGNL
jgi:hypothetical protein